MGHLVGYCKECGKPVYGKDEIKDYPGLYECPNCGHPHSRSELWDGKPDYIVD